jgi:hypothetical protein
MVKKNMPATVAKNELLVDLTFHDLPVNLLEDFALQVVRPYYAGRLTEAMKDLMEKAIAENEFVNYHIEIK